MATIEVTTFKDKLIITVDSSPSNTIYDTKSYLAVVVDLRFHLHHALLARLGAGHQHRGLEQQPVARLHAGVRSVLVILVCGILGAPRVLLAGGRELAGPQILLLPHVWSLLGT